MAAGGILLVILAVTALCLGQFRVPVSEVIQILMGQEGSAANADRVIKAIRIPRILLSILAGAGLAVSGAAFQSLFSNPLATPDTLGTANGASFGAALGILLGFKGLGVQLSALLFGLLAVGLVFLVTSSASGRSGPGLIMVVLAGMVISSLFSALVSLVKYAADPNDILPVITFWLMGSFSSTTMKSLWIGLPLIAGGTLVLWAMRYRLNALSLSEDEARSLGINLRASRLIVILASASVTASVVSLCGVIGWVGLLIPHISRMLFGNDSRRVIPSSIVFGGLFMLVTDTIARTATQSEIPVSILTAVIGAPVFIILLRKTGGIRV
jgi:iron complex transport system permease protein